MPKGEGMQMGASPAGCAGTVSRVSAGGILLGLAVVLLMTISVGSARAGDLFTFGDAAFCAAKTPVRDFGLSRLPALRKVPESAKPLGYGAVSIYGGWSRVMPQPFSFGYGFSEDNYRGVVPLDWTVTAQLWTANRNGTTLREVDREELFIGDLDATHQPHIEVDPLEGRRGFYRFDMQIVDRAGDGIGSYGAYFKVVPPTWKPRLGLSHDIVRPGERLLIRVENYGSETVTYGESFRVQRFEDGAWAPVADLTRHPWFMWLGALGPGGTGRCSSLSLPPDTAPGRYRIAKQVGTLRWPKGKRFRLTAPFEVIESGAEDEY